jgi:hypothetical protein
MCTGTGALMFSWALFLVALAIASFVFSDDDLNGGGCTSEDVRGRDRCAAQLVQTACYMVGATAAMVASLIHHVHEFKVKVVADFSDVVMKGQGNPNAGVNGDGNKNRPPAQGAVRFK